MWIHTSHQNPLRDVVGVPKQRANQLQDAVEARKLRANQLQGVVADWTEPYTIKEQNLFQMR